MTNSGGKITVLVPDISETKCPTSILCVQGLDRLTIVKDFLGGFLLRLCLLSIT